MKSDAIKNKIYWQAHRGGGLNDAPDNTMAAFLQTWKLGGIPEADVRTTLDGIIVCLHDNTLKRTTIAPKEILDIDINKLNYKDIKQYDAGSKFEIKFSGENIPTLENVFKHMKLNPSNLLYIDIKSADLIEMNNLIIKYHLSNQILVASPRQSDFNILKKLNENIRTMLWLGGSSKEIISSFNELTLSGFVDIDQIQLHLKSNKNGNSHYELDSAFLKKALDITNEFKIDLEVFPFQFSKASLYELINIGICWYATDETIKFKKIISEIENSFK